MTKPQVSAVICTYDRYDLLPKAIESLDAQTVGSGTFEVVVVDNSPNHERSAAEAQKYAGLEHFRWITERTPGLSNARNVGTFAASGEIVAFMDDDAIADPGWIEVIAGAFQRFGDEVAMIGGRVDPIWGAPRPSWLSDELQIYVSVIDWPGRTRDLKSGEWLAGTNVAYRKSALDRIGGFSTGLGRKGLGYSLLSNDETDVAEQLTALGYKAKYVPAMRVEHLVEPNRLTQSWFRRRVAWQAVSDYLKQPKKYNDEASGRWDNVTLHFAGLPPSLKSPAGFFAEETDPERFQSQLGAIYDMTLTSLSGFNGLSLEPLQ